jgi:hypothetical protein
MIFEFDGFQENCVIHMFPGVTVPGDRQRQQTSYRTWHETRKS